MKELAFCVCTNRNWFVSHPPTYIVISTTYTLFGRPGLFNICILNTLSIYVLAFCMTVSIISHISAVFFSDHLCRTEYWTIMLTHAGALSKASALSPCSFSTNTVSVWSWAASQWEQLKNSFLQLIQITTFLRSLHWQHSNRKQSQSNINMGKDCYSPLWW